MRQYSHGAMMILYIIMFSNDLTITVLKITFHVQHTFDAVLWYNIVHGHCGVHVSCNFVKFNHVFVVEMYNRLTWNVILTPSVRLYTTMMRWHLFNPSITLILTAQNLKCLSVGDQWSVNCRSILPFIPTYYYANVFITHTHTA